MSLILAIDPGPTNQGYVLYDSNKRNLVRSGNIEVQAMLIEIKQIEYSCRRAGRQVFFAIEQVQNYGRNVGQDVFMTCRNAGRFQQEWSDPESTWFASFPRIKSILGVTGQGINEASVRTWMRDRLAEWHACTENQLKGRKATPGPLYGIKDHAWSALAVAIAFDIKQLGANYYQ